MPLPDLLRPFNWTVTSRVLAPLGGRVGPFAILTLTGRRSGRTYSTTLLAFERDGTVAIALTYGRHVDWARNVMASGCGTVELRGETYDLTRPRLVGDDVGRQLMPPPVRVALSLLGVHDFFLADRA